MQHDDYKNEKIIEKYKYLYENRELILAPYIKQNDNGDYYLEKEIDSSMIIGIKNFLISECDVLNSEINQYLDFIKNNSYFYPLYEEAIIKLKEQRDLNIYLRNVPTFSVWKILDIVRRWYYDDEDVLNKLDIYFNLERFMLTGIDWKSGYFLNKHDLCENYSNLYMFPHTYINIRGNHLNKTEIGYSTFLMYPGNDLENEDNYYAYKLDDENSSFINIDINYKRKLYNEFEKTKTKKYCN